MTAAAPHLILPVPPPYPDGPCLRDELLHELFAETAGRFPERTAIRLAEADPTGVRRTALPYAELRQRASQFARHLWQRGVTRGDRVVICLPRSLDQYMAILGVLEAGAAYGNEPRPVGGVFRGRGGGGGPGSGPGRHRRL